MRSFEHFAVIDWSGQAVERPSGLALAHARIGTEAPVLLAPAGGWSRAGLRDWIRAHADAGTSILIGLDMSPALPFLDQGSYFPGWSESPADAKALWALIDRMSGADRHLSATSFTTHAEAGRHFRRQGDCGDLFPAGPGRFRVCEYGQRDMYLSPYSCFNLVGAAQVGKSSLTGMRVLHGLGGRVPVWPFDPVPASGPVIVEIYTALAARAAGLRKGLSKMRDGASLDRALTALGSDPHRPLVKYSDHATDAIVTAAWLRNSAAIASNWTPQGLTAEIAATEGWTFGVA